VALLDAIAAQPYDRVSIVCVVPLAADGQPDGVSELSEEVEELVAGRLGPAQRLSTLGVLVPATGVSGVPRSVLAHRWHATVVAVDEDGRDARHASREVHPASNHAAHAALVLATAAGIWTGMAGAPFDDDIVAAGHQDQRVRLVRTYVRAARSHGLIGDILRTTLVRKQDSGWMAERADAEPERYPDLVVGRAVDEYLNGPGAALRRTPYRSRRRRQRVRVRLAFRMLWLFVRGRLRDIPVELRAGVDRDVLGRVNRFAERLKFGGDSAFLFDGRAPADTDLPTSPDGEVGRVEVAQALVDAFGLPEVSRRFAAEWKALRALVFGLADAGPLPDGCTVPESGVRRRVVPVDKVCAPPMAPDTTFPEWVDEQPRKLVARIGRRLIDDATAAGNAFVDAVRRMDRAKLTLPAVGARQPTTWLGRIRWLRRRMPWLARIRWYGRLRWFVWLVIAAATWVGLALALVLPGRVAGTTVTDCVAVFVLDSAVLVFPYLVTQFQQSRRHNLVVAEYEDARRSAEHEAVELIRLAAAWEEYADWASMIASVVHQTSTPDDEPDRDPVDIAALPRPSAFVVARAETDGLQAGVAATIGRRCFGLGWITEFYTRLTNELMERLRSDRGLAADDPAPDPDTDLLARRFLRGELASGAAHRRLLADIRAVTSAQVPDLAVANLFSDVRPVGDRPEALANFLTGLCTPETEGTGFNRRVWHAESGYPDVPTSTRIWLPDLFSTDPPGTSTLHVDLDSCLEQAIVLSVRLDLTPSIPWSDLALFARPEDDREEWVAVPQDNEVG
jgi:hypothetical protein